MSPLHLFGTDTISTLTMPSPRVCLSLEAVGLRTGNVQTPCSSALGLETEHEKCVYRHAVQTGSSDFQNRTPKRHNTHPQSGCSTFQKVKPDGYTGL